MIEKYYATRRRNRHLVDDRSMEVVETARDSADCLTSLRSPLQPLCNPVSGVKRNAKPL